MSAKKNEIVMALARNFMSLLQNQMPGWSRAFYRFDFDELKYGSIASYERAARVDLIDPFTTGDFYPAMNDLALALRDEMDQDKPLFCVFLLTVDESFDYKITFEYQDPRRWRISKMEGSSGIPTGLT